MEAIQKQLLENVFDTLDRLFDGESTATDLYAQLFATNEALDNSLEIINLATYVSELENIVRSGETARQQRENALSATDNLRAELNEILPT